MPPHEANATSVNWPATRVHTIGTLESTRPGTASSRYGTTRVVGSAAVCAGSDALSAPHTKTVNNQGTRTCIQELYQVRAGLLHADVPSRDRLLDGSRARPVAREPQLAGAVPHGDAEGVD